VIEGGLAGCSDGSLRAVTTNPSTGFVSVPGYQILSLDDPIVAVVPAGDLYVAMSHTGVVSLHALSGLLFNNLQCFDNYLVPGVCAIWASNSYAYTLDHSR
jgi:hypothetical protein